MPSIPNQDSHLQYLPDVTIARENYVDIAARNPNMLIAASNDIEAILEWVNRYQHSPNTLAAARKDAERFYLWIQSRSLGLADVRKNDCEGYRIFLKDPQPAAIWCGPKKPRHTKEGISNPDWKPFAGPLKESSVRQSCTQIFGLYEFLSNAGYVNGNPWRLLGKLPPAETQSDFIERFLDKASMSALQDYILDMKDGTKIQRKHFARVRWIFSLLYLSAARRTEFTNAKMRDVRNINGKWWWKVKGKGGKVGDVPVNDELLSELVAYRLSLGLPPYPSADENTPLVAHVSGEIRPITPSALHKIVKQVLADAALRLDSLGSSETAAKLRLASTHWMRHTSATDQANAPGADLKSVSKNLRHTNISTTSIYLHAERDARHEQTQRHQMWKRK